MKKPKRKKVNVRKALAVIASKPTLTIPVNLTLYVSTWTHAQRVAAKKGWSIDEVIAWFFEHSDHGIDDLIGWSEEDDGEEKEDPAPAFAPIAAEDFKRN